LHELQATLDMAQAGAVLVATESSLLSLPGVDTSNDELAVPSEEGAVPHEEGVAPTMHENAAQSAAEVVAVPTDTRADTAMGQTS
jgi:hypothetical protein